MLTLTPQHSIASAKKLYALVGKDGKSYLSPVKGLLGGNKALKIYGKLDCTSALSWITKGKYIKNRVFFSDEQTAILAGYRPCAKCMPQEYKMWKQNHEEFKKNKLSFIA